MIISQYNLLSIAYGYVFCHHYDEMKKEKKQTDKIFVNDILDLKRMTKNNI